MSFTINLSKEGIGPFVQIRAQSTKGASTDVRVLVRQSIRLFADFPQRTPKRIRLRRAGMSPLDDLIPDLAIPLGAEIGGSGSSKSLLTAQRSIILRTDLTLSSLAAYSTPQLKHAGWHLTATGSSEQVFWSTWTFVDEANETWRGRFFVLQMPDQRREYHIYIHADWAGEQ